MLINQILPVLIQAAQAGGKQTVRFFGQRFTEKNKAFGDVVTQADLAADKKVVDTLRKKFPSYNIISEERKTIDHGSRFTFVIDPLDGTANFKINSPLFSTAIALFQYQTLVAGVVYVPITKETFWASRAGGAFKNGRRIHVAKSAVLSKTIIGYTQGWKVERAANQRHMDRLYQLRPYRALNNWSPALDLCRLAEGKIHGFVVIQSDLYDIAAGKLIAREAGAHLGPVSPHRGDVLADIETTFVGASNKALMKKLQLTAYRR